MVGGEKNRVGEEMEMGEKGAVEKGSGNEEVEKKGIERKKVDKNNEKNKINEIKKEKK